jgi:uncharacterized protein YjiS (DUF1127 family)
MAGPMILSWKASYALPYAALQQRGGAGLIWDIGAAQDFGGFPMATLTHSSRAAVSGAGSFRPFGRLMDLVHTMRERARAIRELSAMSDAELHDIGLTRSDLPHLFDRH